MKRPWSRHLLFWPVVAAGLLVDGVSKEVVWATVGAPDSEPVTVIDGLFQLHTSWNPGALWGIGGSHPEILTVATALAAAGILLWLFRYLHNDERWLAVALAMIQAGALGNLLDRILYGRVRDFLYFFIQSGREKIFQWPIFNLADTWLVVGAVMIVLQSLFAQPRPDEPAEESGKQGTRAARRGKTKRAVKAQAKN